MRVLNSINVFNLQESHKVHAQQTSGIQKQAVVQLTFSTHKVFKIIYNNANVVVTAGYTMFR